MELSNQSKSAPKHRRCCCHFQKRHRHHGSSLFIITLLSLAISISPSSSAPLNDAMRVIGSYGPNQFRKRNGITAPENIPYSKLTRINYGPFQINEQGSIWGQDSDAIPTQLFGKRNWNPPSDATSYCHFGSPDMGQKQCAHYFHGNGLIDLAHNNGVEVYPVIGGSSENSEEFSELASDPGARSQFVQNAILFMRNYDFDGLDISWQFPQSLDDMSNYGALLTEVRQALDLEGVKQRKTFGLTATLPCSHNHAEFIDTRVLDSVLSEFNLLSLDFHGPWDNEVGVNAPLYDAHGESVNSCVFKYTEGGASRHKMNLGIAFYGHSYRGGKNIGDECITDWAGICSDTRTWLEDGGSPRYHNIYKEMPDLDMEFDGEVSLTPLASNRYGVVSFDDPRSICIKTDYAIENNLGGFMITDLTGDMLDDKSTPLLDTINFKLLKRNIRCLGREFEDLFQWRDIYPQSTSAESFVVATSPESNSDAETETVLEQEHRYTCGFGQGDAKERCSNEELDDLNCDFGTCPENMICFVVPCTKPRVFVAKEKVSEPNQEQSFSKSKPMPRKKRPVPKFNELPPQEEKDPRPIAGESYTKKARPVPSREEMEVASGTDTATQTYPTMSFSCGLNFDHAKSCSIGCSKNGLPDCPSGQFCFWLECSEDTSSSSNEAPVTTEVPVVTTQAPPEITEMKYQCGETRDMALTCSEECGYAWACPEGKDCYNVPCPI